MTEPSVQQKSPQEYIIPAYDPDRRFTEACSWIRKSRAETPLYMGDCITREDTLQNLQKLSPHGVHLLLVEDYGGDDGTADLYVVPEPGRDKDVLLACFEFRPDDVTEVAPHVFKLWWD